MGADELRTKSRDSRGWGPVLVQPEVDPGRGLSSSQRTRSRGLGRVRVGKEFVEAEVYVEPPLGAHLRPPVTVDSGTCGRPCLVQVPCHADSVSAVGGNMSRINP